MKDSRITDDFAKKSKPWWIGHVDQCNHEWWRACWTCIKLVLDPRPTPHDAGAGRNRLTEIGPPT
jgi:hypothetical protein